MRANANLSETAVLHRTVASEPPRIGLLRELSPVALESALGACRRHVLDGQLLAAFEACEAGTLERSYMQLEPAAVRCEAWLIRWPPGTLAPLHDHGAAYGIAEVIAGALHELRFRRGPSAPQHRDWKPGEAVELALGTCHEVRNAERLVAYSIHVYAPRLEHMTFYDRGAAGELRPLREERRRAWQSPAEVRE